MRRQKNDAADVVAICESVSRSRCGLPVKTREQQAMLAVHRVLVLLIGQRTQFSNALRAIRGELGLVAEKGREGLAELVAEDGERARVRADPVAPVASINARLS